MKGKGGDRSGVATVELGGEEETREDRRDEGICGRKTKSGGDSRLRKKPFWEH